MIIGFCSSTVCEGIMMIIVDESVANIDICGRFCGSCPTWTANNLKAENPSLLFCCRGRSPLSHNGGKKKGCNCSKCGVYKRYKLVGDYFCGISKK